MSPGNDERALRARGKHATRFYITELNFGDTPAHNFKPLKTLKSLG